MSSFFDNKKNLKVELCCVAGFFFQDPKVAASVTTFNEVVLNCGVGGRPIETRDPRGHTMGLLIKDCPYAKWRSG